VGTPTWFKRRGYRHFDRPVGEGFIRGVLKPDFVRVHSFSPLIHFVKRSRRYKAGQHQTVWKERPIMFASHRDACILSYYASLLNTALEMAYKRDGLGSSVIAYRKLGKGNAAFSAEAYRYALANAPCTILAFDVTDFFGSLDHKQLKQRLKALLGVDELPPDWYQVFKAVTRYHFVDSAALKADEVIGPRYKVRAPLPIASIAEVKARGIPIRPSETWADRKGIPQGTPVSAVLANLYLYDFDLQMLRFAREAGAFYRRYSDDILFICPPELAKGAEEKIRALLDQDKLTISELKTERTLFDPATEEGRARAAQYLGFAFSPAGAVLRASSVSRRWRKLRGAVKRTRKVAAEAAAKGEKFRLTTRKLRRQFSPTGGRNFSSYARRAATAFGADGAGIVKQIRRFDRAADAEIRKLRAEFDPKPTDG